MQLAPPAIKTVSAGRLHFDESGVSDDFIKASPVFEKQTHWVSRKGIPEERLLHNRQMVCFQEKGCGDIQNRREGI
jgi:hypothetical protein